MKAALALFIGVLLGAAAVWRTGRVEATAVASPPPPKHAPLAAAQGRVEGMTESVEVGAATDGVIKAVFVKEGDTVTRNQPIAAIDCENLTAETRSFAAAVEAARQARVRVRRGSREEERRIAAEEQRAAQAIQQQARRQHERMQQLLQHGDISRHTAENAQREWQTAEAAANAAAAKQNLAEAGALPEEEARSTAEVKAAEERQQAATAKEEKCMVRAPITGTMTRLYRKRGEGYSTLAGRPIATMADLTGRRIRAEVDERDLGRVHKGQKVRIQAEGHPEPFAGTVIWTAVVMGRKTARSPDPAEKSDRDILEALIQPEGNPTALPIGLRVVVEFLGN